MRLAATFLLVLVILASAVVLPGCRKPSAGTDGNGTDFNPYDPETMAGFVGGNPVVVAAEDSMADSLAPTSEENRARLADAVRQLVPVEGPGSPIGSRFPGYYLMVELTDPDGVMRVNLLSESLAEYDGHYYEGAEPLWDVMCELLPVSTNESGDFGLFLMADGLTVAGMGLDVTYRYYEADGWRIPYLARILRRARPVDSPPADPGEPLLVLTFIQDGGEVGAPAVPTVVTLYQDYVEMDGSFYHLDDVAPTVATSVTAG